MEKLFKVLESILNLDIDTLKKYNDKFNIIEYRRGVDLLKQNRGYQILLNPHYTPNNIENYKVVHLAKGYSDFGEIEYPFDEQLYFELMVSNKFDDPLVKHMISVNQKFLEYLKENEVLDSLLKQNNHYRGFMIFDEAFNDNNARA